ncbi:MAG: 4Fe-4S dicluster domain-containing protein, partial [Gammaproteobacteria bacterium]
IMDGEPVIKRVTTLSGNALRTPKNFLALLGTPVSYLLDICGVDLSRLELVILGNSITGAGLSDLQHPVSQGMNCVIATGTAELQFNLDAEPCIRCGTCIDACPVQLNPVSLAGAVKRHDEIGQEELGLLDCIECGACAWTCPSRIPLLQIFRAARQTLAADKQQAHIAGHWQARFEALLSRRRRQAGGEDKTTRAKQTAGSGFSRELAQQEIAAAVARVEARRGKVIAATSDRKEQK